MIICHYNLVYFMMILAKIITLTSLMFASHAPPLQASILRHQHFAVVFWYAQYNSFIGNDIYQLVSTREAEFLKSRNRH